MGSRDRGPDREDAPGETDQTGYPLLFKDDARSSRPGLLARILDFFREAPADPEPGAEGLPARQGSDEVPEEVEEPRTDLEASPAVVEAERARETPAPPVHRVTLQMLPGRLIPVDARRLRQEIRFLRPSEPGRGVTLGAADEDPPDHVTVRHSSLERHHARMRYRQGHWWIQTLSRNHPVLLNGRALDPEDGPRHLKDGDRVRLGEVDFRFRLP